MAWRSIVTSALAVMVVLLTFKATSGLDCYVCTDSPNSQCDSSSATCAADEVCSNVVFRRYQLGVIHTKGCKDRSTCYNLQDLNEDRYCSTVPSECTYCCDSNFCNTAPSLLFSSFLLVIIVVLQLLM